MKERWIRAVIARTKDLMNERVPVCTTEQLRDELIKVMPEGEKISMPAMYRYLNLDSDYWMEPRDTVGAALRIWNHHQIKLGAKSLMTAHAQDHKRKTGERYDGQSDGRKQRIKRTYNNVPGED